MIAAHISISDIRAFVWETQVFSSNGPVGRRVLALRMSTATGKDTHLTHMNCRSTLVTWSLWTVVDLRLSIPVLYGKTQKNPTFLR